MSLYVSCKRKFQTFALFCMLCAFFWVIPLRLNFICRRFGTLFCSIVTSVLHTYLYMPTFRNTVLFHRHKSSSHLSVYADISEHCSVPSSQAGKCEESSHISANEDGRDSVPKRRHIKFRCRGITQKKA